MNSLFCARGHWKKKLCIVSFVKQKCEVFGSQHNKIALKENKYVDYFWLYIAFGK